VSASRALSHTEQGAVLTSQSVCAVLRAISFSAHECVNQSAFPALFCERPNRLDSFFFGYLQVAFSSAFAAKSRRYDPQITRVRTTRAYPLISGLGPIVTRPMIQIARLNGKPRVLFFLLPSYVCVVIITLVCIVAQTVSRDASQLESQR
jgi:hypothetical protein